MPKYIWTTKVEIEAQSQEDAYIELIDMDCPFEKPVKKIPDSKEFEGLWVVVDKAGMIIGFPLKDFEADYIVQAINCHEKYKIALEKIADDNSYEPCTPIAKQVLKEAEKE